MTHQEAIDLAERRQAEGFDNSEPRHAYAEDVDGWVVRVGCSQCAACVINGLACHETGCYNSPKARPECDVCGYAECAGLCADPDTGFDPNLDVARDTEEA